MDTLVLVFSSFEYVYAIMVQAVAATGRAYQFRAISLVVYAE